MQQKTEMNKIALKEKKWAFSRAFFAVFLTYFLKRNGYDHYESKQL